MKTRSQQKISERTDSSSPQASSTVTAVSSDVTNMVSSADLDQPSKYSCCQTGWSEWVVVVVLLVAIAIVEGVAHPNQQAITPNDPSLSFPLKAFAVPSWLLFLLVFFLPIVVFVSLFGYRYSSHRNRKLFRRQFCVAMLTLAQSISLTMLLTSIIKYSIGRPRPNFFALSDYDVDSGVISEAMPGQARLSFPSGHASISFAGLAPLSFYAFSSLFEKLTRYKNPSAIRNKYLSLLIALSPLALATLIACSRLYDYWHHYSDTLGGALLGFSIAYVTFRVNFPPSYTYLRFSQDVDLETGVAGDLQTSEPLN